MKIGIIGAMAEEIKELKQKMDHLHEVKRKGYTFFVGKYAQHELIVVQSGIGKVMSSVTTTLLITQFQATLIINTGSAGGIGEKIQVGDIVIADALAYHDVDVTGFGYAYGQLPQMPLYFKTTEEYLLKAKQAAEKSDLTTHLGLIVTGDCFIDSDEKIDKIKQTFPKALACEMEGAAIAQSAHVFQVPFLVIRSMSDTADHKATQSFDDFILEAGKKSAQMVCTFLKTLPK